MDTLTGIVHRITYQNKDNGYTVLKVKPEASQNQRMFDVENDTDQLFTVTGNLGAVKEGETVDFSGAWEVHAKYGTFLNVKKFQIHTPTSKEGLKRFLATSHFKGIGPTLAAQLVDTFGEDLPRVIEDNHKKLATISGITKDKAEEIYESWQEAASFREELINLQGFGMTSNLAQKVYEMYGSSATNKVKENPYQLAQDVWGVGFGRADEIAQEMGFEINHPERIKAGVMHTLIQASEQGHVYLPFDELLDDSQKKLGVNRSELSQHVHDMINEGTLIWDQNVVGDGVYLKAYYIQEMELAKRLQKLLKAPDSALDSIEQDDMQVLITDLEEQRNFALASEQKRAVVTSLTFPVSIITGGPGTGKSTTVNTIVAILKKYNKSYVQTAPTGRAAKRMSEITGEEAYTIHRLLKLQPGDLAEFNEGNPLPHDVVIVDEASMLDMDLMYKLVCAINPGTHIIFVGDADQLPSVQAGNILSDLIRSKAFPTVELQTIFRQGKESSIISNSHRIKQGVFPEFLDHPTDFYLFEEDNVERVGQTIVELVTERIPQGMNIASDQIQVLAPLYKTAAGVSALNENIQNVLNPASRTRNELQFGYQTYREGDRVMQLRNNYEKEVFNGEVGRIISIEKKGKDIKVKVRFDEGEYYKDVIYEGEEIRELTLAYALSVHKSQGSEYPAVVMPVVTSHFIMLQRNLLYTAVTRAKNLVVLVGSKKAMFIALGNDKPQLRYSGLGQRLQSKG